MRLKMRWLPNMDLNHDKQIQSLLCYHYTIRQLCIHRLAEKAGASSRRVTLRCGVGRMGPPWDRFHNVPAHPGLLPRGEGEANPVRSAIHELLAVVTDFYQMRRDGERTLRGRKSTICRISFPLPKGEGQGEGETGVLPQRGFYASEPHQ